MKQYEKSGIDIVSVRQFPSGGTEISYRPLLDSMYYCPGVTIWNDAGREKVAFVRCGIKEKCSVDVAPERVDEGQWRITIPASLTQIDLVFSDGEAKLQQ